MLEVEFGAAVAARRAKVGITQAELGRQLGIGEGEVALLENGARGVTLTTVEGITRALHCAPGELLGTEDERSLVTAWRSGGFRALLAWAAERAPGSEP